MFKNFFRKARDFVSGIVSGIGNIVSGIIGGAVKLVTNVVDGFLGAFGFSFDMPEYENPSSFQTENQGILLNTQSAVRGIPVIYGTRRVGGTRVYMATGGQNNKYLFVILAVAEGEIDGYTKIFINDEEQEVLNAGSIARSGVNDIITEEQDLTLNSTTPDGSDSTYFRDGRSLAVLTFYPGRENQSANNLFVQTAPGWNNNSQLRGIAYVAARFEFLATNDNPFQGIPEIKVEVRGKKVLTTYSSKDTNNDTSTYESDITSMVYSDNPAPCLLDYLRNPRYGKGLKDNRIDFTSFFNLQQNVFDNSAQLSTNPSVVTELVKCDAVINTEDTMFNNTKRLLQSCRGFLPYVNGKYRLKFEGGYDSSTSQFTGENPADAIEITDDMIIGSIDIQSEDKNAKYNEAQVTFANEDKDYDSDTVIYQDASYISQDGEPLILTTSHPTLTNYYRVQQYAKYLVDRSRNQLAVNIKITNEGQSIVAGDLVRITHQYNTALGGTNITDYLFKAPTTTSKTASLSAPEMLFRVVSTKLNYDNTVDLQLMEHRNEVFTLSAITVNQPPQCGPNQTLINGRCVDKGGNPDPDCRALFGDGYVWDPNFQNADGTIGKCVLQNVNQCPPGETFDPALNRCIPNELAQKVVRVTTFTEGGTGVIQWDVDTSRLPNARIGFVVIQYSFYNFYYGGRQGEKVIGVGGGGAPITFRTTQIPENNPSGFIRPGATIYYKVFQAFGTLTASPPVRLDQKNPGDDNGQYNAIGIPFGDNTIVQGAAVGGGTQTQAVDAGGNEISVDEVRQTTTRDGFD